MVPPVQSTSISGALHLDLWCAPLRSTANHLFAEVWEDLKAISGTARTISREEPGFAADFRLGGDTHREILATATDFLSHFQNLATVAKFVA